ncbi:uncharacterized protein N7503_010630 [Penicillium pulvis]|uniref:uncharacterized protein n=1 Tax=Penicillium pulvis TaxID=1562058 RepID=UPI0025475994|nr:uncharacterized protein N7503_010630 [Penicillium pulvis]KAJ5785418.1 hypothetical protein N7503_010630 [Penicillium pulvis]
MSSLDYDEALALPMPKPRHIRTDSDNRSNPFQDDNERTKSLKKRSATDPVVSRMHASSEPVNLQDIHEGKKKSRFEMIKSKLSFKDLRKELVKEDLGVQPATPPHRAFSGSAIPTLASSSQESNVKTKVHSVKRNPPTKFVQTSNLTREKLSKQWGKQKPSSPNTLSVPKHPVTKDSPPNLGDLTEGEGEVKYLPKTWVDGSYRRISNGDNQGNIQTPPPTVYAKGESPIVSLSNYLPSFKERLDKMDLSPEKTSSGEGQNRSTANQIDDILGMINSIQRRVDGGVANMNKKLEELCAWIGDQLQNQITSNGDLSRANSDLFSKQCQISREMMKFQLDIRLEIGTMERRLSTFENKIIDELQNKVRSLARSYEELNNKTETMIARHSFIDNQSFIELQVQKNTEIEREIAYLKSCEGSSISKDVAAFAPTRITPQQSFSSNGSSEPLIKQVLLVPPTSPDVRTTPRHMATPDHVPVTPKRIQSAPKEVHATPRDFSTTPIRPRVVSMVESKSSSLLPRSVSLTGKGIIKGIKDIASSTSDTRENKDKTHLNKAKSHDESKKWNLFSMRTRRREDSTSNSSGSKFHWSRRSKDIPNNEEQATISSRSSTPPVPAIPRNPRARANIRSIERIPTPFPSNMVDPINSVHPAFRIEHRGPNGASASSYETALESFRAVDTDVMKQSILDGSVSAFAEAPSLESDDLDSNSPLLGTLTPKLRVLDHVIEDASLSANALRCSGDVQKDISSTDTLQEWDHVSVIDTKST